MSFQAETSEQLRRRILESCQEYLRMAIDSFRELSLIIVAYQNDDENKVFSSYNRITEIDDLGLKKKKALMLEIATVGGVLSSREDFIRLISEMSAILDFTVAAADRTAELTKRRWKVNDEIMRGVEVLTEAVLDCLTRFKEAITTIVYGGTKVFEAAENVESSERNVDNIYRKLVYTIISSNMKIPLILITKEIAEFLENIADKSEESMDTVKILSLTT